MTVRDIVRVDEAKCDGCGQCVTACAEGVIALVGGKARLVSESTCDGLGACLGHCPQGAITIERAEAASFDEAAVARHLGGLRESTRPVARPAQTAFTACPGSRVMSFAAPQPWDDRFDGTRPSGLRQWPVQLHLVPPIAPYFRGADLLLAADCVAYAVGAFHRDYLAGRSLAIACPKLDSRQDAYLEKLVAMIDEAEIASLTVMVMEVPCCGGLVQLARLACTRASRSVPVRVVVVTVQGEILSDTSPALGSGRARGSGLPVVVP